jgi:hypothetical protein
VGKDLEKDGVAIVRGNRIEERADLIVAWDWLDAKERLRIIMALTVVELALVLQKRRRLQKKMPKASKAAFCLVSRVLGLGLRTSGRSVVY